MLFPAKLAPWSLSLITEMQWDGSAMERCLSPSPMSLIPRTLLMEVSEN